MIRLPFFALVAGLSLGTLAPSVQAGTVSSAPGYVDFGKFTAAPTGEFVEVNINRSLIKLAAACAPNLEPEIKDMLNNLEHVRVNVVSLGENNLAATTKRATEITAQLIAADWNQVVTVSEAGGDNVNVFVKHQSDEVIQGLVVVVVSDDKEAVFVNIVGNIKPAQIAALGERFDIEPLRELKLTSAR